MQDFFPDNQIAFTFLLGKTIAYVHGARYAVLTFRIL